VPDFEQKCLAANYGQGISGFKGDEGTNAFGGLAADVSSRTFGDCQPGLAVIE